MRIVNRGFECFYRAIKKRPCSVGLFFVIMFVSSPCTNLPVCLNCLTLCTYFHVNFTLAAVLKVIVSFNSSKPSLYVFFNVMFLQLSACVLSCLFIFVLLVLIIFLLCTHLLVARTYLFSLIS